MKRKLGPARPSLQCPFKSITAGRRRRHPQQGLGRSAWIIATPFQSPFSVFASVRFLLLSFSQESLCISHSTKGRGAEDVSDFISDQRCTVTAWGLWKRILTEFNVDYKTNGNWILKWQCIQGRVPISMIVRPFKVVLSFMFMVNAFPCLYFMSGFLYSLCLKPRFDQKSEQIAETAKHCRREILLWHERNLLEAIWNTDGASHLTH